MRRVTYILVVALMVLSMTLLSCAREYEIKPAPIHELGISFSNSLPAEVILYIRGGLADSATKVNEIKILGLTGTTLDISVTTKRPKGVTAAQVYGYFEKTINLGSDFSSGQIYTVKVNDQTKQFMKP